MKINEKEELKIDKFERGLLWFKFFSASFVVKLIFFMEPCASFSGKEAS